MTTNFQQIIQELLARDHSEALLAHVAHCSESYIKQLGAGKRKAPGYDIGRRLVRLHGQIVGKE